MNVVLSDAQRDAVESCARYCLVLAGAGSGKTLVLTKRIQRLIESTARGEKVLAITFSNKAADELRNRLLEEFTTEQLADHAFVGTIHNFCLSLVVRRGSAIGLPEDLHVFEDTNDRLAVFTEAVEAVPQAAARLRTNNGCLDSRQLSNCLDAMGRARRNPSLRDLFFADPINRMIFDEYRARLLAQHAIDFDGILDYARQILIDRPAITRLYQRVYRHICIDEAQDLNQAQYEVVKALAGNSCTISMVGDPHQAIYGFNGSSTRIMTEQFPRDYPDVEVRELSENYRSSAAVIGAARAIEPSFIMEQTLPVPGQVCCVSLPNMDEEALWVANAIDKLVRQGCPNDGNVPYAPEQCAVLARNRYALAKLPGALDALRLPHHERVPSFTAEQSESDFFRYFHLGLRLIVNPNDEIHLEQLVNDFFGVRDMTPFEEVLMREGPYDGLTQRASDALRQAWSQLRDGGWNCFSDVLQSFEMICQDVNAFTGDDDLLLANGDLRMWRDRFESYCKGTTPNSRSLSGMLRATALGIANSAGSETGVTLSTVHMAKGLEYDIVFIVGLNEGTFPDYRANTQEKQDEERHAMFVAITRSRRYCILTRPEYKTMPWGAESHQTASRYYVEVLHRKESGSHQ